MSIDVVEERGRLRTNLARQLDADGKEIKFDVREDEEQNVKLQETIELLVAAGYFRARIKGLSAFDKVIGGMVWCISLCDIDLDIDLLYEENSTIGQKIKLTEKIVKVLSKMKCQFVIEPHQIQGLDFIHIFPVVQWLVKKAIRAREEVGDALQRFAEYQYDAHYGTNSVDQTSSDSAARFSDIRRVLAIPPKRLYKRVDPSALLEESSRVQSTLLEYGIGKVTAISTKKAAEGETTGDEEKQRKQQVDSLMAGMTEIADKAPKLSAAVIASAIDQSGIKEMAAQFKDEFGSIRGEYRLESAMVPAEINLETMESRKSELESLLLELTEKYERTKASVEEEKQKLDILREQDEQLNEELRNLELLATETDKSSVETMKTLLAQREEVKKRESEFKARCKEEVAALENELANLRSRGARFEENEDQLQHLRTKRDEAETGLREIRLDAAGVNRQIAMLQRRIDDVPSNAELNQYQRRFLELYNQIANKHKETKQFYALFNTLQDVKSCTEREVNLLNSIYDNYQMAMQSDQNKMQFLNQLEQSLESIRQTKLRTEKKESEQRGKRDTLREAYQELLDKQRLYYRTVKDFQEECRKNEAATAMLKEAGYD